MKTIEIFQGQPFTWYEKELGKRFEVDESPLMPGFWLYHQRTKGTGGFPDTLQQRMINKNDAFVVPLSPGVPALVLKENYEGITPDKLKHLLARDFATKHEVGQFANAMLEVAGVEDRREVRKSKRLPDYLKNAV